MSARKPALGFIVVTLFLDVLGLGLVVPILPRLVERFVGDDPTEGAFYVGLLTATYAVMQFFFSPIMGSVSDRFGRRPVLLVTLFGQVCDYLLLAFAPTLGWFFVGRVIAGIGGASMGTAAAYIADVSPPEKRAQNFGLIGVAFGLGFIAGPLMSAVLGTVELPLPFGLHLEALRTPFLVAGGFTLLNALWGLFVVPESLAPENRRPFTFARANPFGTLRSLTRYPAVMGLAVVWLVIGLAQRGLESTWVLFTEYRFHWGVRETGLSLATVGVSAVFAQSVLIRRIMPALGERKTLVLALSVGACGYAAYGLVTQGWMLYVVLLVASLGGLAGPATQGLLSKAVPPSEQGMLQGGLLAVGSLSAVVGPPLATNLFGYFISDRAPVRLPGAAFFSSAALALVALFLARRTFARLSPAPGLKEPPAFR